MKKILTLLAALACTAALNAATLEWKASEIPDVSNNASVEKSFEVNSNLSFELALGDGGTTAPKYRSVSTMPAPSLMFYNKNTWIITAYDATITSVEFVIFDTYPNADNSDSTPDWKVTIDGQTYNASNPIWTGSASEITITASAKTSVQGLNIEYTINTPPAPDNTLDFQTAELLFSTDQVGQGAIAQNVTLSDNETSVDFTTTSTNAQIDASNGYFGTAEDYITIPYRYRPGGNSSKGIESPTKGVFTFPCPGTLTIYAYNNQSDERNLQLIQNDDTILDHVFKSTDAVNPPNSSRNVYPIVEVEVAEGTAYLLWPVNQLMLYGFKFEPVVTTITEGSIIVGGGTVLDQTSQSAVIEDGTLVISTEKETVWAYIQVPESATAVYYKLSDVNYKNGRKVAPEGFQTAMPYEGYWVAPLLLNTNGTLEVQYEDEEGNLSPVSQFSYKVIKNTPTGIEDVIECLPAEDGIIYNIFGQKVDESYKGIVIKNGKKYIQK